MRVGKARKKVGKEVRESTSVQDEVGDSRALKEELVVMEMLLNKPKGWMLRSQEHAVMSWCRRHH
jgi:hypothetical protein